MKVGKQADGHKKPYPTEKRRGIFKRFALPEKTENLYPFQLSGGMARRVLVSTALITDAQLIIADEPTPGMSLGQALEALQMFREMANEGKAVILITHDIDLAFEFADRIAVFYAGTTACFDEVLTMGIGKLELLPGFAQGSSAMQYTCDHFWAVNDAEYAPDTEATLKFLKWMRNSPVRYLS